MHAPLSKALSLGLLLSACSETYSGLGPLDGGAFIVPDSGRIVDARVVDAEAPDTGPFECSPKCEAGRVCECLPAGCGCHLPVGFGDTCDPQVASTCQDGLTCVRMREVTGSRFACTDGRPGSACSRDSDSVCQTPDGCLCRTLNGTVACECDPSPIDGTGLCDKEKRATCTAGESCVRRADPLGSTFICSDGSSGDPCEEGDQTCQTSLGCSCPFVEGREACQCSDVGEAGDPCDPSLGAEGCVSPLQCVVVARGNPPGPTTICGSGGVPDAGPIIGSCDPFAPDPCPPGQTCVGIGSGQFRCLPT
ncbi:MAG: hypothetical protein HYV07_23675 [Deltaproteobacteria bacterium]|nr:hypothetical protein [Deltaproteobacteria bacterium]